MACNSEGMTVQDVCSIVRTQCPYLEEIVAVPSTSGNAISIVGINSLGKQVSVFTLPVSMDSITEEAICDLIDLKIQQALEGQEPEEDEEAIDKTLTLQDVWYRNTLDEEHPPENYELCKQYIITDSNGEQRLVILLTGVDGSAQWHSIT